MSATPLALCKVCDTASRPNSPLLFSFPGNALVHPRCNKSTASRLSLTANMRQPADVSLADLQEVHLEMPQTSEDAIQPITRKRSGNLSTNPDALCAALKAAKAAGKPPLNRTTKGGVLAAFRDQNTAQNTEKKIPAAVTRRSRPAFQPRKLAIIFEDPNEES